MTLTDLFWIYLFLLMLVFVLQWLSCNWEILMLNFVSFHWLSINPKGDVPLHGMVYDYSWADCVGLHDHLRDVPWEDTFKLDASVAVSEFSEWIQVEINVYIPHDKYQIKPQLISIAHKNPFFICTNRINLLNLKLDRLIIMQNGSWSCQTCKY